MVSFSKLLIGSLLFASTTATADVSSSSSKISSVALPERKLEDMAADVSMGTPVSVYEDGEWSDGSVVQYSEGVYTVQWADGSVDYYDDFGDDFLELRLAIQNANGDDDTPPQQAQSASRVGGNGGIEVGTPVSYFDEGWVDGTITRYEDGTYTVVWDDDEGSVDYYDDFGNDLMELKRAIGDATGDDDAPPAGMGQRPPQQQQGGQPYGPAPGGAGRGDNGDFPPGTPVSVYEEGEWSDGKITQYANGVYSVVWDDGTYDKYNDDGDDYEELKQAVMDANGDDDAAPGGAQGGPQEGPRFPNGTPVSSYDDDQWYDGEVVNFRDGNYVVRWYEEGEIETYDSSDKGAMKELTKMAEDANGDDDSAPAGYSSSASSSSRKSKTRSGMNAAGKAVLSVFVVGFVVVGAAFGYKFYENKRQVEEAIEKERNMATGDIDFQDTYKYRDQPDRLPKII